MVESNSLDDEKLMPLRPAFFTRRRSSACRNPRTYSPLDPKPQSQTPFGCLDPVRLLPFGCFEVRVTVAGEVAVALIVGQHHDHVRRLDGVPAWRRARRGRGGQLEQEQGEQSRRKRFHSSESAGGGRQRVVDVFRGLWLSLNPLINFALLGRSRGLIRAFCAWLGPGERR